MQVRCDHCGNAYYAEYGDKGLVDGLRKGWRKHGAVGERVVEPTLDWLEKKEAQLAPYAKEIVELDRGSNPRDIRWQRTEEEMLACSAHCYEQLAFCSTCVVPLTDEMHEGCPSYIPECMEHSPATE